MAKKRSNGEGTLHKRKDGRWEARLMIGYREDGRPNIKACYGKTQKEVKDKVKAFREARASGLELGTNYTFDEWSDIWFENHKDNVTATTQENYRYTLRILKDRLGLRILAEVKPFDIEQLLKALKREGRSDSCLAQCRGMLYQIFQKAEANDLVTKNPVRFADKMRSREPVKRKEAFTTDEVRSILEESSMRLFAKPTS